MFDPFDTDYVNLSSPAVAHFEVTPDDQTNLPTRPRALFANTGGAVVLQDQQGNVVTYQVSAGTVLSIRPVRVLATGTTAQLIAWY